MNRTPTSLDKSLALLVHALEGRSFSSLSALAETAGLPLSTTHRLLEGLERGGVLARVGSGMFFGGPVLQRLSRLCLNSNEILAEVGRPILSALSQRSGRITHLGVLDDNMMTYLVKEGDPEHKARSRPNMQLEAYCSGVGKALVANLPEVEREAYLSTAPFVRLTPTTIVSAASLRDEFALTRARGYAIDAGEMFEDIGCIAVPLRVKNRVVAAISLVVRRDGDWCPPLRYLARLRKAAAQIESRLNGLALKFADAA